ncbi:hypothetical protein V0288_25215, partial [Pannus brasiliensis CCIBt3594]
MGATGASNLYFGFSNSPSNQGSYNVSMGTGVMQFASNGASLNAVGYRDAAKIVSATDGVYIGVHADLNAKYSKDCVSVGAYASAQASGDVGFVF